MIFSTLYRGSLKALEDLETTHYGPHGGMRVEQSPPPSAVHSTSSISSQPPSYGPRIGASVSRPSAQPGFVEEPVWRRPFHNGYGFSPGLFNGLFPADSPLARISAQLSSAASTGLASRAPIPSAQAPSVQTPGVQIKGTAAPYDPMAGRRRISALATHMAREVARRNALAVNSVNNAAGKAPAPLNPLATPGVQTLPQGQRLFLQQEYLKEQAKLIAAQKTLADAKNKAAPQEPTGVPINAKTPKPVSPSAPPSASPSVPSSVPAPSSKFKTIPSWVAASNNQEAIKNLLDNRLDQKEIDAIVAAAPRTEELYQNIDALEEKRNEIKRYARNIRRGGITQEERDELAKLREEQQALEARVDALSPRTSAEAASARNEQLNRDVLDFGKEVLISLTPIPGVLPARLAKGAVAGVGALQRGANQLGRDAGRRAARADEEIGESATGRAAVGTQSQRETWRGLGPATNTEPRAKRGQTPTDQIPANKLSEGQVKARGLTPSPDLPYVKLGEQVGVSKAGLPFYKIEPDPRPEWTGIGPGSKAKRAIRGHRGRPKADEQSSINEIFHEDGCHMCGTFDPGTKRGNAIADHQPPRALGEPEAFVPHCRKCSNKQGPAVGKAKKRPRLIN